jgi:hypothetical protein
MISLKNVKKSWQSSIILIATLFCIVAKAQEVRIELARKKINLNEFLQIRMLINNEELKQVEDFPEISNFEKAFQVSLEYTNQKGQITQGIEQNYKPKQTGTFTIPSFELRVNGKKATFKGEEVLVVKNEKNEDNEEDLLAELEEEGQKNIALNISKLQDFFLLLNVSQKEVFVGEEVNISFALYVAEDAPASLDLYQLDKQLTRIVRQIRPSKAWEEDYRLDTVRTEKLELGKRKYTRYTFYQAAFYPAEAGLWQIPSLELQMEDKEHNNIITLKTQAVRIEVKPIPKAEKKVPVGRFQWQEAISYLKIQTGQAVSYQINVVGSGNFAMLNLTQTTAKDLEIYTPTIEQIIRKTPTQLLGIKTFKYAIVAKKPGKYPLKNLFYLVYFNTETQKYDTLRSRLTLEVSGKAIENISLEDSQLQKEIKNADSRPVVMGFNQKVKIISVVFLGLAFLIVLYQIIFKNFDL